ncbi:MAG: hypothetical protein JRG94_06845 [Deltaproteobacteria bacterium]|nr:hypothetical protein [Deltaproteobacteria bacterium]
MKDRHSAVYLSMLLAFTLSCASISQETIAAIEKPVDCSSASQDVAYLDDEKSGFFGRLFAGITAVLPPGSFIVIGRDLFGAPDGIWTDKFKVASGSYNRKIDDKIAGTKQQCGEQASAMDSEY